MNQNENKRSFTTAVLILASWACTSSVETGDASGGAGQAPTGNAGSPSSGAGSGATAGGTVGGAGAATGGTSAAGTAAGGASGGQAGSFAAGASSAGLAGTGGGETQACPASVTIKAGDNPKTLTVGSVQRTYLVHAPPGYTGKAAVPVVFDFHGLSGNGAQQKSLSRWDKLGDTEGFIVVYPDGIDNAWNAGLCCTEDKTIDDVAFVKAVIVALRADACIDPRRVYASGCSNGGGMSYKLACEAADVITGVAPVDFDCVDGSACSMCKPSRPITQLQFRGTNDSLVDYDGAGAFIGAQQNFALWGGLNSCTGEAAALASNAACEAYPMCGGGVETILCTVPNGTHCGSYASFMIPQVAWNILKNETLP
jgi:polyhydroxybutyrate depolymerase